MEAENASQVSVLVACRHLVEDYVKRLDAACEEYYGSGKTLFPSLSRADEEDITERCRHALQNLIAIEPDAMARWDSIEYPSEYYKQMVERMRAMWVRRRNLLRTLE